MENSETVVSERESVPDRPLGSLKQQNIDLTIRSYVLKLKVNVFKVLFGSKTPFRVSLLLEAHSRPVAVTPLNDTDLLNDSLDFLELISIMH